ncbi:MAG: hypothetical protein M3R09_05600 [Actinomycetota bacterium]|jgi:RNase P subunit RPR2|nr:hypothetical protein [Actinomycetota bacterium]MDQ3528883.1 hypothetical protein [Actinomycetota bacterium]
MTTIKATCPSCGEVGLTPDEIELRVAEHGAATSYYAFSCPSCQGVVRKPADERVVRLLVSGGVPVLQLDRPDAVRRRLSERFDGPALTHDDLLDFHTLLQGKDWFSEVLAIARRQEAARK